LSFVVSFYFLSDNLVMCVIIHYLKIIY